MRNGMYNKMSWIIMFYSKTLWIQLQEYDIYQEFFHEKLTKANI